MMRPVSVFSVAVDTHLTCHPAVSMVTTCFPPPLPSVFSVIQPPLPLPIDKVRIQIVLVVCPESS